jgi:hypothetical protein
MREVAEGIQTQGANEAIQYPISCDPAAVTITLVRVIDVASGLVVTTTVMPAGTASIADDGDTIVLPLLRNLTLHRMYRVDVRYSDGLNTIEPFFRVWCE